MMRLKLDNEGYISGYGCLGNHDYPEYDWVKIPEVLVDNYGQPLYFWDGEKPVYKPQGYTAEQLEEMRKEWVKAEIEKLYPPDVQLKILTETMIEPTEAYQKMQEDRDRIKVDSKKIDFQIK